MSLAALYGSWATGYGACGVLGLLSLCQWLEQTSLSVAIRESVWGFPIVESVHVLGLSLFGVVILLDLRVLGLALTGVPATEIASDLRPWMTAGLILLIASGMLMFLNAPVDYYNNTVFRIKVLMLLLAAANALVLRAARPIVSLILWAGIIVAGRMITYSLLGVE
jgi:hypothetical protein